MLADPLALSIAMLAVFVLLWGAVVAVRRRRDRKQGVLMAGAALVLLVNVLIWAWPAAR